jgi:signal peptidase I
MKKIKKINWKRLGQIIYWSLLVVLAIIAIATAISALNLPGSYKLYTVQSGSMEPAIKIGSLIISKQQSSYQPDDIITFKSKNSTITHRLIEIQEDQYITQGDANDAPDPQSVKSDIVLGKVILKLPLIGKPIAFAKTKEGFILLIVIPATIIVYSEILAIKNQIQLIKAKKKSKNKKK